MQASRLPIATFSVSSISIKSGLTRVRLRISATLATMSGRSNSTPEIFTEIGTGSIPRLVNDLINSQVCSSTHRPISTINMDCSAIGINLAGEIMPNSECFQRINASAPMIFLSLSNFGW